MTVPHAVRFRTKGPADQIGPPVGLNMLILDEYPYIMKVQAAQRLIIIVYDLEWFQIQIDSIQVCIPQ